MLHRTVLQLDFFSLILHPPKEKGNKREKKEKKNRNVLFDHPN